MLAYLTSLFSVSACKYKVQLSQILTKRVTENYSKYFSHRVAFNGVIKVADFGLTENVYQRNYFRQGSTSVKLPIKWMAVESLHDRVFSEKSDVVCVYIAYEIHY